MGFKAVSYTHLVNNLINEAIPDLPLNIANEATELGRITQPIALAVRAKLWMLAASPLFNGNPDYAQIKYERGVALFKTTEDPTLWLKAAQALSLIHIWNKKRKKNEKRS